ncbi:hypothetical protein BDV95DRAFT_606895 [Massariosphaeria phaeospora]|uniref:Uncharacterized protein n=1 Tax=Massariosphaeria phaeospora TaxID=100035 RepID=A0A7C8I5N8_9PLEO|nr:hypothetical protein BDV95DRAFT_606895 [Massariosphaeria phaeospora]
MAAAVLLPIATQAGQSILQEVSGNLMNLVSNGIKQLFNNKADQAFRSGWTQQQLGIQAAKYPGKNILVIFTKHQQNFTNSQVEQLVCECPSGDKYIYTGYAFEEGDLTNEGDGGYLNWAFTGHFDRNGNKVHFNKHVELG